MEQRPRDRSIEFWFDFGSTYAYLTSQRVTATAASRGVTVRWMPFLLGPIFTALGWSTSPFNVYPQKGAHMWRDLERRAALYGIPFARPPRFPQNGLLASRLMLVGQDEGWGEAFARIVFGFEFAEGLGIDDADVLRSAIVLARGDADRALERAAEPAIKERLRAQTDRAATLAIFGAPTFRAGAELFWGDDRLEEALTWVDGGHPLQVRADAAA